MFGPTSYSAPTGRDATTARSPAWADSQPAPLVPDPSLDQNRFPSPAFYPEEANPRSTRRTENSDNQPSVKSEGDQQVAGSSVQRGSAPQTVPVMTPQSAHQSQPFHVSVEKERSDATGLTTPTTKATPHMVSFREYEEYIPSTESLFGELSDSDTEDHPRHFLHSMEASPFLTPETSGSDGAPSAGQTGRRPQGKVPHGYVWEKLLGNRRHDNTKTETPTTGPGTPDSAPASRPDGASDLGL